MPELENSFPEEPQNPPLAEETDSPENITPPQAGASFFAKLKGNWPKIVWVTVLGLGLLMGIAYASYHAYQYYELKHAPDDWCISAKSFGECIERGCFFVDVGLSNDPRVRSSPWCVPSLEK